MFKLCLCLIKAKICHHLNFSHTAQIKKVTTTICTLISFFAVDEKYRFSLLYWTLINDAISYKWQKLYHDNQVARFFGISVFVLFLSHENDLFSLLLCNAHIFNCLLDKHLNQGWADFFLLKGQIGKKSGLI